FYNSFFFQAEDGIRDRNVTGVQTCALPIFVLSFLKNSDANTVDVARAIDSSKDELNEQLPEGAELTTVIDTSDFIEESVSSVTQNLLIGGAISVFILLLFLKSVRATIVI